MRKALRYQQKMPHHALERKFKAGAITRATSMPKQTVPLFCMIAGIAPSAAA